MEMAQYIISIFKHYLPIVWSWGFEKPVAIKDGLQFQVNGFKHQGKVQLLYDDGSDTFMYHLLGPDNRISATREFVFVDNLVPSIDSDVELVENYEERIRQEYQPR